MGKKLLETGLGRFSELVFELDRRVMSTDEAVNIFKKGCEDYSIYSQGGVVVYMTKKECEQLKEKLDIK